MAWLRRLRLPRSGNLSDSRQVSAVQLEDIGDIDRLHQLPDPESHVPVCAGPPVLRPTHVTVVADEPYQNQVPCHSTKSCGPECLFAPTLTRRRRVPAVLRTDGVQERQAG
jgi:hypothetical protein